MSHHPMLMAACGGTGGDRNHHVQADDGIYAVSGDFATAVKVSTVAGALHTNGISLLIVAGTDLYASLDRGATWTHSTIASASGSVRVAAAGTTYGAITSEGVVYKSTDHGQTWVNTATLGQPYCRTLSYHNGKWFVVSSHGVNGVYLYYSTDLVTWTGGSSPFPSGGGPSGSYINVSTTLAWDGATYYACGYDWSNGNGGNAEVHTATSATGTGPWGTMTNHGSLYSVAHTVAAQPGSAIAAGQADSPGYITTQGYPTYWYTINSGTSWTKMQLDTSSRRVAHVSPPINGLYYITTSTGEIYATANGTAPILVNNTTFAGHSLSKVVYLP